ncbi:protein phosphatase 1 regulatory subunit 1C [Austrofundulus limnaeus]|uniref:Protein phosphatase 1 regulatory subunit 1C n=1 Tax=Austrofundulus limnaeus TaxID=52670 RepID=A0A2I4CHE3_AUSLI|nr:PREDICTED: protein phosphatase 1 regulatory subunit 1C-like [Austrofundulus limnaeus]
MEPGSPKKIQFAVPPLQGQLDPQAAEHIRRRRPTPATLQIYRPSSDVGDHQNTSGDPQVLQIYRPSSDVGDHQNTSGDPQVLQTSDASQRKQSTYAPPTMKGKLETSVPEEEEEEEEQTNSQDD